MGLEKELTLSQRSPSGQTLEANANGFVLSSCLSDFPGSMET